MKFGPLPVAQAQGAILAHSMALPEGRLAKGKRLVAADIRALQQAGITSIIAAQPAQDDMDEDAAAATLAAAFDHPSLDVTAPHTGRVNLIAAHAGLFIIRTDQIDAFNRVDEGITIATLPAHRWVQAGQLIATIKIIPYALPASLVQQAAQYAANSLEIRPALIQSADLILTRLPGMSDKLLTKAQQVTRARLEMFGVTLSATHITSHDAEALAKTLTTSNAALTLILGASATSDRADIVPASIAQAGGEIIRFGMPVDPGNLLVLGQLDRGPIIGLPGCARSPALNGVDWVLQRLVAGLEINGEDIAQMGVGGLLKESTARRQPRLARAQNTGKVIIMLLAAGASRRMGGEDKLLRMVGEESLLRRAARMACAARADQVMVVLGPDHQARRDTLKGLPLTMLIASRAKEGMGRSLAQAITQIRPNSGRVIVALADMPQITQHHYNLLIDAAQQAKQGDILRLTAADGRPGHPVLFDQSYFEMLEGLEGDQGARDIISAFAEHLRPVPTDDDAPLVDLDTPEAWAAWEARANSYSK